MAPRQCPGAAVMSSPPTAPADPCSMRCVPPCTKSNKPPGTASCVRVGGEAAARRLWHATSTERVVAGHGSTAIHIPTNRATTGHCHCLCLCLCHCHCPACWSHNPLRISASAGPRERTGQATGTDMRRDRVHSTGEGSARRNSSIPRLQTPHHTSEMGQGTACGALTV